MGRWVHRTSKQLLDSVSPASLPEPQVNYISEPDLSAVAGFPEKYWIITGDVISLMSQAERDAVDAALEGAQLDSIADELTNMRAFAEVVLDEINDLRGEHSLQPRTLAQLRNAVRSKL